MHDRDGQVAHAAADHRQLGRTARIDRAAVARGVQRDLSLRGERLQIGILDALLGEPVAELSLERSDRLLPQAVEGIRSHGSLVACSCPHLRSGSGCESAARAAALVAVLEVIAVGCDLDDLARRLRSIDVELVDVDVGVVRHVGIGDPASRQASASATARSIVSVLEVVAVAAYLDDLARRLAALDVELVEVDVGIGCDLGVRDRAVRHASLAGSLPLLRGSRGRHDHLAILLRAAYARKRAERHWQAHARRQLALRDAAILELAGVHQPPPHLLSTLADQHGVDASLARIHSAGSHIHPLHVRAILGYPQQLELLRTSCIDASQVHGVGVGRRRAECSPAITHVESRGVVGDLAAIHT